jgi:hypothetical protein
MNLAFVLLALAAGDNLIHNGAADSANGWERAGVSEYFAHDESTGAAAKGSLRISVPKDAAKQPFNWFQRVELPAKPPRRLKLSAQLKLAELARGTTAAVMVQVYDDADKAVAYAWTDQLDADTDWRAVRGVFEVPSGAKYIRVLAYLAGPGTAWFDDLALEETDEPVTPPPGPRAAVDDEMASLARECAADIEWLFDGDAARKEAARSRKPVLLYVRCTDDEAHLADARTSIEARSIALLEDGYAKDLVFRASVLASPDVRELIARRTVPACATYLLGKSRFEHEKLLGFDVLSKDVTTPALLLADSRGKVLAQLDRVGTLSESFIDDWLRRALAEYGRKSASKDANELYLEGELDAVLAATAKGDSDTQQLRARALLRLGRLEEARKAIGSSSSGKAMLIRGTIELRNGSFERAREHFDEAAKKLEGQEEVHAAYWSAWCTALLGQPNAAREQFRQIAGKHPWGRRAAACALESGPRPFVATNVRLWPRSKELPATTEGESGNEFDLARSVTAMLELQRDDGSFGETSGAATQGFVDPAITAIVADALARVARELDLDLGRRADSAGKRADAFLVGYANEEQSAYRAMDPFNTAYVMDALLRQREKSACGKLAARITSLQLPDGNWTVYNTERPASFNTALCVRALRRAREAGVGIDEKSLERGLDALEAMRQSSGRFPYSTAPGHEWMTTEHGSIARDPLCEAVLLECGRGSKDALEKALQRFLEFHGELRAPTKRLYDYFDERGHGGYYYFFAYRNALESARQFAPAALQKKVAAVARESVLAAQEGDGTWMDKFLLGRAYGTAMALQILK